MPHDSLLLCRSHQVHILVYFYSDSVVIYFVMEALKSYNLLYCSLNHMKTNSIAENFLYYFQK